MKYEPFAVDAESMSCESAVGRKVDRLKDAVAHQQRPGLVVVDSELSLGFHTDPPKPLKLLVL